MKSQSRYAANANKQSTRAKLSGGPIKTIVTPIAYVLAGTFRLGVGIAGRVIGGLVAIVARVAWMISQLPKNPT